jgi:dTMP kinase
VRKIDAGLLLHAKAGDVMRNETELLLFAASRAQLTGETILPAIRKGMVVVSDRFYDSTTVYQGIGRGMDLAFVRALNDFVTAGCKPDRTFLLDLDVALSRARQRRRVRPVGQHDRLEHASQTEDQVEEAIWKEIDGLLI